MIRYISIKQVLDNTLDHPLLKDVSLERAVNYVINFIRIVGMPKVYNEKTELVTIKDYRGVLPCDLENIIQVRTHSECNNTYRVFRYSTDSFHMSENKQDSYDLTYKVQGSIIFTSIRDGIIEIAYRAIPVDSEGYPMVPDNSSYIRALELYIKKQCFTILFDTGKITPQVYNNVCQDYAWAVGQAQSDLVRPSIDEMQSISNSLNTLVPRVNEHSRGFVNDGSMEKLRLQ